MWSGDGSTNSGRDTTGHGHPGSSSYRRSGYHGETGNDYLAYNNNPQHHPSQQHHSHSMMMQRQQQSHIHQQQQQQQQQQHQMHTNHAQQHGRHAGGGNNNNNNIDSHLDMFHAGGHPQQHPAHMPPQNHGPPPPTAHLHPTQNSYSNNHSSPTPHHSSSTRNNLVDQFHDAGEEEDDEESREDAEESSEEESEEEEEEHQGQQHEVHGADTPTHNSNNNNNNNIPSHHQQQEQHTDVENSMTNNKAQEPQEESSGSESSDGESDDEDNENDNEDNDNEESDDDDESDDDEEDEEDDSDDDESEEEKQPEQSPPPPQRATTPTTIYTPTATKSSSRTTPKRKQANMLPTKANSSKGKQLLKSKVEASHHKNGSSTPSSSYRQSQKTSSSKVTISSQEYNQLDSLFEQFCKVPLLAEFSRPVSYLHPELVANYSSIVKHPMDLSKICRKIRRRFYHSTKQIKIDVWRIFSNCVKFHSHPAAKENAIQSFISIALHLRDYFNALWQEYMLPSEITTEGETNAPLHISLDRREVARQTRLANVGSTPLSHVCLQKVADAVRYLVEHRGRVDALDAPLDIERREEIRDTMDALKELRRGLLDRMETNHHNEDEEETPEYTIDDLSHHLRDCCKHTNGHDSATLPRLVRLLGKCIVPIFEMSCRGVNQSSIWGCMAAAIWARESSKKRYWPALVMGILAPLEQREDWHKALTKRNETRLPARLASELKSSKRKAEIVLAKNRDNADEGNGRDQMSYFLVEFMGKHEFIWVREADIIENFDAEKDPNTEKKATRPNGAGNNAGNARLFTTAVEEGKWALEEFEMQLRDPCGERGNASMVDQEEEDVSYYALCQSDENESDSNDGGKYNLSTTDEEEEEELFQSEGLMDLSIPGRKKAKKRLIAKRKLKDSERKKVQTERLKEEKVMEAQRRLEQKRLEKSQQKAASKERAEKLKEIRAQKKLDKLREKENLKEQRLLEMKKRKRAKQDKLEEERKLKKKRRTSSETTTKKRRGSKPTTTTSRKSTTPKRKPATSRRAAPSNKPTGIPNKRLRAEAVVRNYVSRIAHREKLTGLISMPSAAAGVASYGLLGMALAFRAAAGEIPLPGERGAASSLPLKPWDKLDVDGPLTSQERCDSLEKQIELLEQGITTLVNQEEQKRMLIQEAEDAKKANRKNIANMDKDARAVLERYGKRRKSASNAESARRKTNSKSDVTASSNSGKATSSSLPFSRSPAVKANNNSVSSSSSSSSDDSDSDIDSSASSQQQRGHHNEREDYEASVKKRIENDDDSNSDDDEEGEMVASQQVAAEDHDEESDDSDDDDSDLDDDDD